MFFNPEQCRNETEVESKFIVQYLLPALGYTPQMWNQEVSLGSIRLDFLVFTSQLLPINLGKDSPLSLVLEAKSPRHNLTPHISKLKQYLIKLSVPYGVLTNGKDFRIFERQYNTIDLLFQCQGRDIEEKLPEIRALIGYEEIQQRRMGQPLRPLLDPPSVECHDLNSGMTAPPYTDNVPPIERTISFDTITTPSTDDDAPSIDNAPPIERMISFDAIATPFMERSQTQEVSIAGETDPSESTAFFSPFHRPVPSTEPFNFSSKLEGESLMKAIAIYHNKGGVGKTTTVVNLAAALSKLGKKVLIIDLDSQANTTFATGLVQFEDEEHDTLKDSNVLHLLSSEELYPIQELVRTSTFCSPGVDVVPSHIDLMSAENDLNSLDYSRMVLGQKLREVETQYDVVLIDTPPSLNLYARVALIAADYLLIPSDLKPFANQGLTNVKGLVKDVNGFRKMLGKPPVSLLGVLATKVSTNHRFRQSTLPKRIQAVVERYEFDVLDCIIFERDDLAKCSEQTRIVDGVEMPDPLSVLDFKPQSDAAQEFENLAKEVLSKIG